MPLTNDNSVVRGDSGVAGEGRIVGVRKCHSWGKRIMPLTNVNSDWMSGSNASSGLHINIITPQDAT